MHGQTWPAYSQDNYHEHPTSRGGSVSVGGAWCRVYRRRTATYGVQRSVWRSRPPFSYGCRNKSGRQSGRSFGRSGFACSARNMLRPSSPRAIRHLLLIMWSFLQCFAKGGVYFAYFFVHFGPYVCFWQCAHLRRAARHFPTDVMAI